MTNNQNQMTSQELEEFKTELKIEKDRNAYYKEQLRLLKEKKLEGKIQDPANFKIKALPVDMSELMELESKFK